MTMWTKPLLTIVLLFILTGITQAADKPNILVIWGDKDRVMPRSHAEALPGRCAVEVLSDCGHMVQMEAPGEVNRLIAHFLQNSDD